MTSDFLSCPCCNSRNQSAIHSSFDYFFSNEPFLIMQCNECGLRITNPQPIKEKLELYYKTNEYLSHNGKKNDIVSRVYLFIRKLNIQKKYSLVTAFSKGLKLLDYGCGTGELLNYFKCKGFLVKGLEPNDKARSIAIKTYGLEVVQDINQLKSSSFNIITFWHSLEHIPDMVEVLEYVKNLLDKSGLLVIALPNYSSWDACHYGKFWAGYDLPRHLYHFNKASFQRIIEKVGFKILSIEPQKFDAFYISLLSEKYRTGKRNFIKAIINGLRSNVYAMNEKVGYSSQIFLLTHSNT